MDNYQEIQNAPYNNHNRNEVVVGAGGYRMNVGRLLACINSS